MTNPTMITIGIDNDSVTAIIGTKSSIIFVFFTGLIYGEKIGFTWYCDSQHSIDIEMDDGYGASAFLVAEEAEDSKKLFYLQLCIGEEIIWMYED